MARGGGGAVISAPAARCPICLTYPPPPFPGRWLPHPSSLPVPQSLALLRDRTNLRIEREPVLPLLEALQSLRVLLSGPFVRSIPVWPQRSIVGKNRPPMRALFALIIARFYARTGINPRFHTWSQALSGVARTGGTHASFLCGRSGRRPADRSLREGHRQQGSAAGRHELRFTLRGF